MKVKAVILIVAIIFIVSVIMTVYSFRPSESSMIEIVQDGTTIYTFDLSKTENQVFIIKSVDGSSSNTVTIADGQIFMSDAECPDQTCVKSGILKSESMPIVCLPNKLIIRFCEE